MLKVENISKRFDSKPVLQNISFGLETGEALVILGPSGCGKTTLLRLISGLAKADTGRILMNGHPVSRPVPDVAL